MNNFLTLADKHQLSEMISVPQDFLGEILYHGSSLQKILHIRRLNMHLAVFENIGLEGSPLDHLRVLEGRYRY